MNFVWDEAKRLTNISKHGFDFVGIEEVFDGPTVTVFDNRFDYGEIRFVTFGIFKGCVVSVTHLEDDWTTRIISVRKAAIYEEEKYYRGIAD